jgi:hypothetical protein
VEKDQVTKKKIIHQVNSLSQVRMAGMIFSSALVSAAFLPLKIAPWCQNMPLQRVGEGIA